MVFIRENVDEWLLILAVGSRELVFLLFESIFLFGTQFLEDIVISVVLNLHEGIDRGVL